jgi:hypothetical protein
MAKPEYRQPSGSNLKSSSQIAANKDIKKEKKNTESGGPTDQLNTEHVEHITNNTSWNPENFAPGASVKDSAGSKSNVSANSGSANEDNHIDKVLLHK